MANTRISDLTASASNLASTDLAPVVQTVSVGPVKMTGLQLAGGLLGSTTFNGSTVTTSSPVLNLTQTWNAGAVTFTGLKFNATDTASASGSLLLDLQVGGSTIFNVSKASNAYTNTKNGGFAYLAGNSSGGLLGRSNNNGANGLFLGSGTQFGFTDGSGDTGNIDVILRRAAAATLQLGEADTTGTTAPTAQFLRVQSWSSSTNNDQTGADFTIQGSRGTGAGAGGSIIFQVAPAGSSGTAQNAYSTALTIDSSKNATFTGNGSFIGAITLTPASNSMRLTGFSGSAYIDSGDSIFHLRNYTTFTECALAIDTTSTLALRNGNSTGAAQRFNVYNTYTSSTNYETFKVDWITTANTCLIGTEKGSGGGTARDLAFQTDGTTRLTIATGGNVTFNNRWTTTTSTSATIATAAQTSGGNSGLAVYNGSEANPRATIGVDGVYVCSGNGYAWSSNGTNATAGSDTFIYRPNANIIALRGSTTTNGAALNLYTYGASPPSAPSASQAIIYADTSGGKIRLMALFPSGAAQQIAIEP